MPKLPVLPALNGQMVSQGVIIIINALLVFICVKKWFNCTYKIICQLGEFLCMEKVGEINDMKLQATIFFFVILTN